MHWCGTTYRPVPKRHWRSYGDAPAADRRRKTCDDHPLARGLWLLLELQPHRLSPILHYSRLGTMRPRALPAAGCVPMLQGCLLVQDDRDHAILYVCLLISSGYDGDVLSGKPSFDPLLGNAIGIDQSFKDRLSAFLRKVFV